MKLSLGIIKQFIDLKYSFKHISEKLILSGTEVTYNTFYDQFEIAEIISVNKHPNADKLSICQVHSAIHGILQVVCGANNIYPGMKAVFAPIGTKFTDFIIEKRKIRNIESYGMLCSANELHLEYDNSNGIMEFRNALVGTSLTNLLDTLVITFEIMPNRGDLMSALGIAREIHGLNLGNLKSYNISARICEPFHIENFCLAKVSNISLKTPEYILNFLSCIGIKNISGPVDIANYVMYAIGQPLHIYDADSMTCDENKLTVEKYSGLFCGLNGKEYMLDHITSVCNNSKAIAIAGMLGSQDTRINQNTRSIIIESAYYEPSDIAKSVYITGIHTEASSRFSKGIDPLNIYNALNMYLDIISGKIDYIKCNMTTYNQYIVYDHKISEQLTGQDNLHTNLLHRMHILETEYGLSIPSWRHDIKSQADIVHELLRVTQAPILTLSLPQNNYYIACNSHQDNIHNIMRAHGFNERITWSFTSNTLNKGIKIINYDNRTLRTSLLFNLLDDYAAHIRYKYYYHGIYEIGNIFIENSEHLCVAGVIRISNIDHINIIKHKAIFDIILSYMNYEKKYINDESELFDKTAYINVNGARCGLINKSLLTTYNIKHNLFAFEIPYTQACNIRKAFAKYKYYTSVIRDITFIKNNMYIGELIKKLFDNIHELEYIQLKDIYNQSVTLEISLRSLHQTMSTEYIQMLTQKIFDTFTENGFVIPGL